VTTGVRSRGGETLPADAVVSNGDVGATYKRLIKPRFRRKYTDAQASTIMDYSMSLVVIYFGTDRKYDDIAHHEIIMGPRYRGAARGRLRRTRRSRRISRSTCTAPPRPTRRSRPPGCDAFYVLSPVPHLDGPTDWTTAAKPYRDCHHQVPRGAVHAGTSPNTSSRRRMIDPVHFRDTLSSEKGAAFSVQPTLFQSAWFRPHNRSEDIPNLYFAGAGTHPGAGLPGVISSGKIVAELIGEAA
jgi:phytoene desaturase